VAVVEEERLARAALLPDLVTAAACPCSPAPALEARAGQNDEWTAARRYVGTEMSPPVGKPERNVKHTILK